MDAASYAVNRSSISNEKPANPPPGGLGDRRRVGRPDLGQPGVARGELLGRLRAHHVPLAPASSASTSAAVGIAAEQASLEATIAPAALANVSSRSSSQPASSPWHSAPPNASPAPRPLTTSTGIGGTWTD